MWIVAIIIGLLFGSLGSVLLIRLSEKVDKETIKGILRGRSKCPQCGATLKARNLIPLLSFILQKGKCEHCQQRISRLYPILEIGSAIIFVLSFLAFQYMGTGTIIFRCIVNRLCLLLIVYDVMKYELHVPLRTMLIIVMFVGSLLGIGGTLTQALASFGFFAIGFGIIFLGAKRYARAKYGASEGFGEGDMYLGAALGLGIPFVLKYHFIARGRSSLANSFLLFIILSCVIGIILRIVLKLIKSGEVEKLRGGEVIDKPIDNSQHSAVAGSTLNNLQSRFPHQMLIPFIPAMILAFWLLLRKADLFISLLSPLG